MYRVFVAYLRVFDVARMSILESVRRRCGAHTRRMGLRDEYGVLVVFTVYSARIHQERIHRPCTCCIRVYSRRLEDTSRKYSVFGVFKRIARHVFAHAEYVLEYALNTLKYERIGIQPSEDRKTHLSRVCVRLSSSEVRPG